MRLTGGGIGGQSGQLFTICLVQYGAKALYVQHTISEAIRSFNVLSDEAFELYEGVIERIREPGLSQTPRMYSKR
jgi:hypothetical protein